MKIQTREVQIGDLKIGGDSVVIIGGPCAIENKDQFFTAARSVKQSGANILRGGMFKMRTDSESFQGLGNATFEWVKQIKNELHMPFISEIIDSKQIPEFQELVDVYQVGSRNMYNYSLLKELATTNKPVMLKRGFSATYSEWIKAAEYLEKGGNSQVILCERGIRTFETATRNTLDLNAVAFIKAHTHFPIIVDPSHGTGRPELISAMALAALAAGADGVMMEAHPNPKAALSDAEQALTLNEFENILLRIKKLLPALDKNLHL